MVAMMVQFLRTDIFPLTCHICKLQLDIDTAASAIERYGLLYADCGDTLWHGLNCPVCLKTSIFEIDRNNPPVDLRNFIMVPGNGLVAAPEQYLQSVSEAVTPPFLMFKTIPAWDESLLSTDQVVEFYSEYSSILEMLPITPGSYFVAPHLVSALLKDENTTGKAHFRRLYPDNDLFRSLLTCLSHDRITEVLCEAGLASETLKSPADYNEKSISWGVLLETAIGHPLPEAVRHKLKELRCPLPDEEIIIQSSREHLPTVWLNNRHLIDKLKISAEKIDFSESYKQWEEWKEVLKSFLYQVCTELYLGVHRAELSSWISQVEKGKALFVDAPMGLGKTSSIVDVFATNTGLSAVIFMPTRALCDEVTQRLKLKIAQKQGTDDCFEIVQDGDGLRNRYTTRAFLEDEVYLMDGITENECSHFATFIERYKQGWIKKKDLCDQCDKSESCRFIRHHSEAPKSRIVVTTHRQYDPVFKNKKFRYWQDNPRDFFIVDEDLVLSECYQPICLKPAEIKAFVSTVTNLDKNFPGKEAFQEKLHSLFGKVMECDGTTLIRGVDAGFTFPPELVKAWEDIFFEQESIIPDSLEWEGLVGNHVEVIQNALRKGLVVQKFKLTSNAKDSGDDDKPAEEQYQVYLPNPKTYDLSIKGMPPHVFFDGTMLDDDFRANKLCNVGIKNYKIDVPPVWNLRVWQNTNSDLPKRWWVRDEPKTKEFVRAILAGIEKRRKLVILTSKTVREKYLDAFLGPDGEFNDRTIHTVHYGNLKGKNIAKDCDVAIMLGSYVPSDAVEIAMTLDFIQDAIPTKDFTITYGKIWVWTGSNGQRTYTEGFQDVGRMSKAIRHSEHRQALARTRYLFHDVDFYILSKDEITTYEPYLPIADDTQFLANIFQPRKERADNKRGAVHESIVLYLKEHGSAKDTDIHKTFRFSRTIIRPYREELEEAGVLVKKEGRKKEYRLSDHY